MKIKTTEEYVSYYRKSTEYTIEFEVPTVLWTTGEKGKEKIQLSFCKWVVESDNEIDNGCDFDEASQKIYDSLDEEVQTEIDDYILELK